MDIQAAESLGVVHIDLDAAFLYVRQAYSRDDRQQVMTNTSSTLARSCITDTCVLPQHFCAKGNHALAMPRINKNIAHSPHLRNDKRKVRKHEWTSTLVPILYTPLPSKRIPIQPPPKPLSHPEDPLRGILHPQTQSPKRQRTHPNPKKRPTPPPIAPAAPETPTPGPATAPSSPATAPSSAPSSACAGGAFPP